MIHHRRGDVKVNYELGITNYEGLPFVFLFCWRVGVGFFQLHFGGGEFGFQPGDFVVVQRWSICRHRLGE